MKEDNQNSRRIGLSTLSDHLGKLPPQAVEIEEAVLGALMLERDALSNVIEFLDPDSFYKDAHKEIYDAIIKLFKDNEPIDIKTVTHRLRRDGKLETVGGASVIAELTTKVNSAANIEYHSRIIKEQGIKRDIIRIASEIQKDAYEDTIDVFEVIGKLEKAVLDIGDDVIKKDFVQIQTIVDDSVDKILNDDRKDKELTGIPSGLKAIDRRTAGWQDTDLIIIAARPGMGKTAFVVTALRNAAIDHGVPVAMFSLEMSSAQLVNRLLSAESEIAVERLRKRDVYHTEIEGFVAKSSKVGQSPIFIDDTPGLSILEFRSKARRMVIQHGVKLIVVDYLQLMQGDKSDKRGNREQEISAISRALKMVAKELEVPVIALSQLSRAVESRGGDKRPMLSDLRESGSIEQDADMVAFLYRPEYYGIDTDEHGMPLNGLGEFIIAKHRNGDLDTAMIKFIGKYTKWTDETPEFEDSSQFPTQHTGNTDFTITLPSRDVTGDTHQDDQPFN